MADKTKNEVDLHMMPDLSKPSTPREYVRLFFSGFAMGASDIVPGVSGGTMAFILGVYETLLNGIKSFNLNALQAALKLFQGGDDAGEENKFMALVDQLHLRFLIALGLGILLAIFLLASVLEGLIHDYPHYIFTFFGGLILASVVAIGAKVKWNPVAWAALAVGAVFAFILTGFTPEPTVGAETNTLLLFLSGMIAICAMILPGISGSFILLILGQYENVLGSVRNFEIVNILAVAAGAGIGLLAFSRVLSWLLDRYENSTIALLVGFMLGSVRLIVFRSTNFFDEETALTTPIDFTVGMLVIVVLMVVAGFMLVTVIDHAQSRSNPVFTMFGYGKAKTLATES